MIAHANPATKWPAARHQLARHLELLRRTHDPTVNPAGSEERWAVLQTYYQRALEHHGHEVDEA